jgi:tetratricopeptide (TPR) repeat protein
MKDPQPQDIPFWVFPAGIAAIAFLSFLPALSAEFVMLDDDFNFLNNPQYRGLGLQNLRWMFFTFQLGGVYQPLSWLTNALEYVLWGLNPTGYHLGNMLIHSATAVFAYLAARKILDAALPAPKEEPLSLARSCAAFAALAYAVHPLRVESVAWASNRSYVLPGLFCVLSLWAYLKAQDPGAPRRASWMALSIGAFALSLMSKAIAMTFPAVLLVLDVYPLRRWGWEAGWTGPEAQRAWKEKIPYLVLAFFAAVIAANGRHLYGALIPMQKFGMAPRLAQAFFGISFYLEKTIAPFHLAPFYTLPRHLHPLDQLCITRTLAVSAVSLALAWNARRAPALAAAWACHVLLLLPFLGLSQYGLLLQIAADKWTHMASLPWPLLAGGWLLARLRSEEAAAKRRLAAGAASLLALLAALTWRQTARWHDTEALFTHSIAVDPDCYFCHNNLAVYCNNRGRYDDGMAHALRSLRIRPDYQLAQLNLAVSYIEKGKLDDAISITQATIAADPGSAQANHNMGFLLSLRGRRDEALPYARRAVELDPRAPNMRYNLAYFLQARGALDEAAREYREVLRLSPSATNAHFNLGIILTSQGKLAEAAAHCDRAAQATPPLAGPQCPRSVP